MTRHDLSPTADQWLFTAAHLHHTPSQADGWTYERELQDRAKCIQYIQSLILRTEYVWPCICQWGGLEEIQTRPDLSHAYSARQTRFARGKGTLMLSGVLVHRFYMRRSLKDFDIKLISATILFIASKVEEEAIKLRHIVNECLVKFEGMGEDAKWRPTGDHSSAPPVHKYQTWEREILIAEEVVQDALCFDMVAQHPWELVTRLLKGSDALWEGGAGEAEDEGQARVGTSEGAEKGEGTVEGKVEWKEEEKGEGKGQAEGKDEVRRLGKPGEEVMRDLTWHLCKESLFPPLSILHSPPIIAICMLSIAFSLRYRGTFSTGLSMAAELDSAGMSRRGMGVREDVHFSEMYGAEGGDVDDIKSCLANLRILAEIPMEGAQPSELGLLLSQIQPESLGTAEPEKALYKRHFRHSTSDGQHKKHTLAESTTRNDSGKRPKVEGDKAAPESIPDPMAQASAAPETSAIFVPAP